MFRLWSLIKRICKNACYFHPWFEGSKYQPTVGFTCGTFDLLHAGHTIMLSEAKDQCDYLIVGVQSDPSIDRPGKNVPVQSHEERIIMVKANRHVDEVRTYDTESDLVNLLINVKPDIRILGADWRHKSFTGDDLPITCYFNSRDHKWSTSELRRRILEANKEKESLYEEEETD